MVLMNDKKLMGAVVMNQTSMGGYIPENILVHIATHKNHRGEGLGKKLIVKQFNMPKEMLHCMLRLKTLLSNSTKNLVLIIHI
ncbi:MAG: hypothetical protein ACJA0U_002736 [Salibacteraceae bacterium]|jgi:hypothetical protein